MTTSNEAKVTNARQVILQSLLALGICFAAFVGVYFVSAVVPALSRHVYFSAVGEVVAGALIFACATGLAILMHFEKMSLFLTALTVTIVEFGTLLVTNDWALSSGWLEDFWCIWRHTAMPVVLGGFAIVTIRNRHKESGEVAP